MSRHYAFHQVLSRARHGLCSQIRMTDTMSLCLLALVRLNTQLFMKHPVLRMNEKYSVHVIAIISTLWKIMSSVWQFIQGFQGLFSIFTLQSLSGYQVYYNRLHLPAGPHRYLLRGAELLSQKQLRWRTLLLGSRQLCSEWQVILRASKRSIRRFVIT